MTPMACALLATSMASTMESDGMTSAPMAASVGSRNETPGTSVTLTPASAALARRMATEFSATHGSPGTA